MADISRLMLEDAVTAYRAERGERPAMIAALTAANLYAPERLAVALKAFRHGYFGTEEALRQALSAVLDMFPDRAGIADPEPNSLIEAWEARDRVTARLRYRLAAAVWSAQRETRQGRRQALFQVAYAIATDLGIVIRALGEPDRPLDISIVPENELPLAPGAVTAARSWLGIDAGRLLGKEN